MTLKLLFPSSAWAIFHALAHLTCNSPNALKAQIMSLTMGIRAYAKTLAD